MKSKTLLLSVTEIGWREGVRRCKAEGYGLSVNSPLPGDLGV